MVRQRHSHLHKPVHHPRWLVLAALAGTGDLRRICDLFGVTIATAQHDASVLSHPAWPGQE